MLRCSLVQSWEIMFASETLSGLYTAGRPVAPCFRFCCGRNIRLSARNESSRSEQYAVLCQPLLYNVFNHSAPGFTCRHLHYDVGGVSPSTGFVSVAVR